MPDRPRLTPAMADVRRAVRTSLSMLGRGTDGSQAGGLILVACSGGADSLALAAATRFEGIRAGFRVGALIVEHGLQEATKEVAQATAEKLVALGLEPVKVLPVTVGTDGGTEAAARTARYEALDLAAREFKAMAVLLGHTLNDQAETVLLGLARGSGLRSIAGMAGLTPAEKPGLLWVRPLLEITRQTTEGFCRDSGLGYWEDPHNQSLEFARVKVRTQALPSLEAALGPGVAQALARTAQLVQQDLEYLEVQALAEFQRLAKVGPTQLTITAVEVAKLPSALSGRVIHRCLAKFGATPSKTHVDQVLELALNWHGQKELTLPGVRVVRQGDDLTFRSSKTLRPGAC